MRLVQVDECGPDGCLGCGNQVDHEHVPRCSVEDIRRELACVIGAMHEKIEFVFVDGLHRSRQGDPIRIEIRRLLP